MYYKIKSYTLLNTDTMGFTKYTTIAINILSSDNKVIAMVFLKMLKKNNFKTIIN